MTKARASGPGSPLIAGAATTSPTSAGEFAGLEDDFGAPDLFDFSTSPDALQRLETSDPNTFLSPRDLVLLDSPNESYQDSSSDSASSKRTESSASAIPSTTPLDSAMEQADDVKMEWAHPEYTHYDDDDPTAAFARDVETSIAMGMYSFGENDDAFMDRSFDFDGASASPDGPSDRPSTGGPVHMPSPEMPTIKTNSPRKPDRAQATGHRKQISVSPAHPPAVEPWSHASS